MIKVTMQHFRFCRYSFIHSFIHLIHLFDYVIAAFFTNLDTISRSSVSLHAGFAAILSIRL